MRGMRVVAEADNGRDTIKQFKHHHPDVNLIDLRMSEIDDVESINAIKKINPYSKIIVLTTYDDDEDIYRALREGVFTKYFT